MSGSVGLRHAIGGFATTRLCDSHRGRLVTLTAGVCSDSKALRNVAGPAAPSWGRVSARLGHRVGSGRGCPSAAFGAHASHDGGVDRGMSRLGLPVAHGAFSDSDIVGDSDHRP